MYAEERRQVIADRARREGRVEVAGLAAEFAVTPETVRRDLTDLERRGVLRRVHGGAMPVERLRSEPDVAVRAAQHADEKLRIARVALDEVPADGTVLLDAGTTTSALANLLPVDRELTVVTNSVTIALAISTRPNLRLLLVGGRVRGVTMASVDAWALRTLQDLAVDVAFVATNGLTAERGLTTPDPAEAEVKRAMVACGRRVVLLADASKVGREHFVSFATLADVDRFVTDTSLDPRAYDELVAAGLEVVLA